MKKCLKYIQTEHKNAPKGLLKFLPFCLHLFLHTFEEVNFLSVNILNETLETCYD